MTFYFAKGYLGTAAQILPHFRRYSQLGENRTARKGTGGRGQTTVVSRGGASKLDWLWADDPRRCLEKSVG